MAREVADIPPLEVLLADDEPAILEEVGAALRERGYVATTACDGGQVLAHLESRRFDLVITDVRLPTADGFEILRFLRAESPQTDVIVISGYASVPDAVAALKEQAFDYLSKPFQIEHLMAIVDRSAERHRLQAEVEQAKGQIEVDDSQQGLVGHSAVMVKIRERLAAFAEGDAPVLITGASGSGKELAARMIHTLGTRRAQPFVAINCAAFPDTLIEAEMFGHVRGAFTGALRDRKGRLAAADGGTLFLDEVAELSLPAQSKLLRVLEEGTFCPVGSNTPVTIDVRLLSATNHDLKQMIGEGRFREDLYYRLKVLDVHMPALSQRRSDIPLLVEHFLRRHTEPGRPAAQVSPRAWAAISQYSFPGNVRELEHAIQHSLTLSRGEDIRLEHLPDDIRGAALSVRPDASVPVLLAPAIERFEREFIRRALVLAEGNRGKAAEALGISRKHLWQLMRDYRITDDDLD
jgi:DNA-binding NtrC family response regulator